MDTTLEALQKRIDGLELRMSERDSTIGMIDQDIESLESRIKLYEENAKAVDQLDARRSSIEVGTPAKGGCLKVYFDPFTDQKTNDAAIIEAIRVLEKAGGVKAGGA